MTIVPKFFVSHIAPMMAGLTLGVMAVLTDAPKVVSLPEPPQKVYRVIDVDCDNYTQVSPDIANQEVAFFALLHLRQKCEAHQEAILLMQTWENDPTAGVVKDED